MKRHLLLLAIVFALGAFAFAQDTAPTGTHQSPNESTAVRPTKKHVRGNKAKAAGGDEARGAKAAGHDIKTGHPIEAGKSIGVGTGRAAKDVAEGTDAEAHKAAHSTKRHAHRLKHKAKGTDTDHDRDRDHNTAAPPPQK